MSTASFIVRVSDAIIDAVQLDAEVLEKVLQSSGTHSVDFDRGRHDVHLLLSGIEGEHEPATEFLESPELVFPEDQSVGLYTAAWHASALRAAVSALDGVSEPLLHARYDRMRSSRRIGGPAMMGPTDPHYVEVRDHYVGLAMQVATFLRDAVSADDGAILVEC